MRAIKTGDQSKNLRKAINRDQSGTPSRLSARTSPSLHRLDVGKERVCVMSSEVAKKAWETRRANAGLVAGTGAIPPERKIKSIVPRTKTKELYDTLSLCNQFTSRREFAATGLKCFRFEGKTVRAFDGMHGIEHQLPEGYEFPPCFVVADFFIKMLKQFLDVEVSFRFKERVILLEVDGNIVGRVATSNPEEWFNFPKLPDQSRFKSLPEKFQEAIDQIKFSAMRDPVTFSRFSGFFIDGKSMFTTNNITISKVTTDFNLEKMIIPDTLIHELRGRKVKGELKDYYFDSERFYLRGDKFIAFSNALEKPLDVKHLEEWFDEFPKGKVYEYDLTEVLKAMKKVEPWTDTSSKRVTLTLNRKMIFQAVNELGTATSEASCSYSGKPISYVFMFDELKACFERAKSFAVNVTAENRCHLFFKEGNLEMLLISLID